MGTHVLPMFVMPRVSQTKATIPRAFETLENNKPEGEAISVYSQKYIYRLSSGTFPLGSYNTYMCNTARGGYHVYDHGAVLFLDPNRKQ